MKKNNYKIMCDFIPDQKEVSEKRFQFLAELYDTLEKRYLTLNQIMDEKWDFFMVVFEETGILQGFFWDKPDVMLEYFKKVDSYIDGLIKKFSSKNINPYTFMVSDHGFNAAPLRSFNFRAWMNENGYIKDKRTFFYKSIPRIYRILTKLKLSKTLFLFKKPKEVREAFQRKLTGNSDIYYRNPGVYIKQENLKDSEYEELRNDLIEKLKLINDPLSGSSPFQAVEKREDTYSGNDLKYAPDIVLLPKENYAFNFSYDSNNVFDDAKFHLPGRHHSSLYGIFLANGQCIRPGSIENISILDIFPTVLHILDVPIPKDTDGKLLREIFKKDSQLYNK